MSCEYALPQLVIFPFTLHIMCVLSFYHTQNVPFYSSTLESKDIFESLDRQDFQVSGG